MTHRPKVLVVGGVACGPKVASRLKRILPEADVTMIEKGELVSYGACGLPYFVEGYFADIGQLTKTQAGMARTPAFFEAVKGFKVRTRTEAVHIDRKAKTLAVKNLLDGSIETLPYDKLVLATGGLPLRPPIPGITLKNVWFMTHPDDAESLTREAARQHLNHAVLVGAGFIGIEMAEALTEYGLEVTLVEMMDQIMPGVLDKDIAALAANHIREKGVRLVLGQRVEAVEGETKVTGVRTDKQLLPADLVLVAVGTRPNIDLARSAGLTCDKAISVNAHGQTSDPDIYAGGDCVATHYIQPGYDTALYVPLGSTANKQGRVIADHIAGKTSAFAGISCSSIVQAFDIAMGRTGLGERQAATLGIDYETVVFSGPDKPHYMPDAAQMVIKMIAAKQDHRLLGVQMAGMGQIDKRLDVAAAVIRFGGTVEQLADIDFCYAPPFSPPIDPLAACAHLMINKLDGIAHGISAFEARRQMEAGNVLVVDVRMPEERREGRLPYETLDIPLDIIRSKAEELPRDREILTFCRVSMRGYEAQRILNAAGLDKVSFIEGGMVAWPFEVAR